MRKSLKCKRSPHNYKVRGQITDEVRPIAPKRIYTAQEKAERNQKRKETVAKRNLFNYI